MEFVSDSEIGSRLIWLTGAVFLALVFLLMLQTVFLRFRLIASNRRTAALQEKWEPILVESLYQIPEILPPPPRRRDAFEFLILWNYLRESLRDEAGENLTAIARQLEINQHALKMLKSNNLRKKLLAVQTLGWMREKSAWQTLRELTKVADPVVSLSAARGLMRIEPQAALKEILPSVVGRADWAFAVVASMLREAGADIISESLTEAVINSPVERKARLLRLLTLAHPNVSVPAVRKIIKRTKDLEILTAGLRILQDPEDLPRVRKLLKDERWEVRVQAAICLGRIGNEKDIPKLAHACGDLEWWVRYRAAEALANLPFITCEMLENIAAKHKNDFARDIIRQVIAEREVSGG